jgi:hypothetical protein
MGEENMGEIMPVSGKNPLITKIFLLIVFS